MPALPGALPPQEPQVFVKSAVVVWKGTSSPAASGQRPFWPQVYFLSSVASDRFPAEQGKHKEWQENVREPRCAPD